MRLTTEQFEKIKNGNKTIECRLFDEKRMLLKVGDKIEFSDAQNDTNKVLVEIVDLHVFPTFSELIDSFPIASFGATNKQDFLSLLKGFYSYEDEKKFGVVGIEIRIL
jgi:ASC-1-like (ASCH) protein